MDSESNYFHIIDTPKELIVDNRVEVDWKEIYLYPLPILLGLVIPLYLFDLPIFISLLIPIFIFPMYILIRYLFWWYYIQFSINKKTGEVFLKKYFRQKQISCEKLDDLFDIKKVKMIQHKRSGKTQYIFNYGISRITNIMVLKSTAHKTEVLNCLIQLKLITT